MRIEEVVGANMRTARERAGLSQTDLGAKLAPHLGDPWRRPQAVSTAELGKRAFTAAELLAISNVLGVGVNVLFSPPIGVRYVEVGGEGMAPVDDLLGAMLRAAIRDEEREARIWTALADLRGVEATQLELISALRENVRPLDAALKTLIDGLIDVFTRLGDVSTVEDQGSLIQPVRKDRLPASVEANLSVKADRP